MSRSAKHLIVSLLISIFSIFQPSIVRAEEEYIRNLDLTVIESDEGDVTIIRIGRYSPFRRYSWFRVGDVIEEVNGVKSTVYELHTLSSEPPRIKYRRGLEMSTTRQIGLEKTVYGIPLYVQYD